MRHIRGRFARDLLRGIPDCEPTLFNIRITKRRVIALLAWMRAESGNELNDGTHPDGGAANNPLGSTYPYNYDAYNTTGVRNYPDFTTGVLATLQTLNLADHHYEAIISAIQGGRPHDVGVAVSESDWGTGKGVSRSVIDYTKRNYRQEFNRPVSEWMN